MGEKWERLVDAENPDHLALLKDAQKSLKHLLDELLLLESLLKNKSSARSPQPPPNKKRKLDDYSAELAANHATYATERASLIQKWNDKTRIFGAAGGGKSGRGAGSFAAMETSTLVQIEQILSNKPRLVARTQLKRSNYEILGTAPAQTDEAGVVEALPGGIHETNVNIFDDDDFYHQLLRDLIDRKTNSSSDKSQVPISQKLS